MPERRGVDAGAIKRTIEQLQYSIHRPVANLLGTDGVQYSSVATVGTTAISVFDFSIDPGVDLKPQYIEVALTQRFTNVIAAVGSLTYHWQARRNTPGHPNGTLGGWFGVSPTLTKGVGSSLNSEDTLSGYIPVGSLPDTPFDVRLMVQAIVASSFSSEVKNSSYVKLVGVVIPGT